MTQVCNLPAVLKTKILLQGEKGKYSGDIIPQPLRAGLNPRAEANALEWTRSSSLMDASGLQKLIKALELLTVFLFVLQPCLMWCQLGARHGQKDNRVILRLCYSTMMLL